MPSEPFNPYESRLFSREIGNAGLFRYASSATAHLRFSQAHPLWPVFLDRAKLSHEQSFAHENYTRFAFELPLEGELFGEVRNQRVTIHPGEVLLIPLGEDSRYGVAPGKTARKIGVGFSGPLLPALLAETGLVERIKIELRDPEGFLDEILKLEQAMRSSSQPDARELSARAYGTLLRLAESIDHHLPPLLADTVALMKLNLSIPFTIRELAGKLGVSSSTLEKLFTTHLRTSPKRYLFSLKLAHARQLLAETALPISSIAEKLGYRHNTHFDRWFKNESGQTPREYRESINSAKR